MRDPLAAQTTKPLFPRRVTARSGGRTPGRRRNGERRSASAVCDSPPRTINRLRRPSGSGLSGSGLKWEWAKWATHRRALLIGSADRPAHRTLRCRAAGMEQNRRAGGVCAHLFRGFGLSRAALPCMSAVKEANRLRASGHNGIARPPVRISVPLLGPLR